MEANENSEGVVSRRNVSPSTATMTSTGRVAPVGTFVWAKVRSVRGNGVSLPRIVVSHGQHGGGPVIGVQDAIEGAVISPDEPVHCPIGIHLEVLGDPASIDVEVGWC